MKKAARVIALVPVVYWLPSIIPSFWGLFFLGLIGLIAYGRE